MIECQICKRQLGTLVGSHLTKHGLTSKQYQEMFPGHPVSPMKPWTEEIRQKQKLARTGRKQSDETKAKIGAGNTGKTRSQEDIDKWRESYAIFLEQNGGSPQKGSKRSEEFCARMSEIAQNRPAELVQAKVDLMLSARRGQTMTEEQKAHYREARTAFMIANPDKLGPKKLFNTKPELQFEEKLIEHNITYRKSYKCGGFLYDFLINEDTIVEIDGPYHYNLNLYGSKADPEELKLSGLKKTQDKDALKDKTAIKHGLKIYRIKVGSNLPQDWRDQLSSQGCNLFQ